MGHCITVNHWYRAATGNAVPLKHPVLNQPKPMLYFWELNLRELSAVYLSFEHYDNVTWKSYSFRSPVIRLFNSLCGLAMSCIKETSKSALLAFCEGNSLVNSLHKGPVMRKKLSCDDVIMKNIFQSSNHPVSHQWPVTRFDQLWLRYTTALCCSLERLRITCTGHVSAIFTGVHSFKILNGPDSWNMFISFEYTALIECGVSYLLGRVMGVKWTDWLNVDDVLQCIYWGSFGGGN